MPFLALIVIPSRYRHIAAIRGAAALTLAVDFSVGQILSEYANVYFYKGIVGMVRECLEMLTQECVS